MQIPGGAEPSFIAFDAIRVNGRDDRPVTLEAHKLRVPPAELATKPEHTQRAYWFRRIFKPPEQHCSVVAAIIPYHSDRHAFSRLTDRLDGEAWLIP
jgi:hypothetical protein